MHFCAGHEQTYRRFRAMSGERDGLAPYVAFEIAAEEVVVDVDHLPMSYPLPHHPSARRWRSLLWGEYSPSPTRTQVWLHPPKSICGDLKVDVDVTIVACR